MKILKTVLIVVMVLVVGSVFADSELRWSNPASANGTYIMSGAVVSNCTFTGASPSLTGTGTNIMTGITTISNATGAAFYGSNVTAKVIFLLKVNGAGMVTSVTSVNTGEAYVDLTDGGAIKVK